MDLAGAIEHGGSLARARALFPDAPEPWLDLSTGINPVSYPHSDLPDNAFTRLPDPAQARRLTEQAAACYGAPGPDRVVAAPGTQVLLPMVASLVPPGRAAVLSPTYAEHARAAALAGHRPVETASFDELRKAALAVVVNPNNPDGRVVPRQALLELAAGLRGTGGLLVVDEAFMDVGPRGESPAEDVDAGGIVVLRSFGKFFGLAGVRLGFALAAKEIAARLAARLGPWAVSGPALEIALPALADTGWQDQTRRRLAADAVRLDALFARAGVAVTGGTTLFRHLEPDDAPALHATLGRRGILLRRFPERPATLRCGLPGRECDWTRLEEALTALSNQQEHA